MDKLLPDDHAELGQLLDEALSTSDVKQLLARVDLFWARLAMHIRAEHLHLFPAILAALPSKTNASAPSLVDAETAITTLRHDHDSFMRELTRAINVMRELANTRNAQPDSALAHVKRKLEELKEQLAVHNATEEEGVYVWIGGVLNADDRAILSDKLKSELEKMPPRFAECGRSGQHRSEMA